MSFTQFCHRVKLGRTGERLYFYVSFCPSAVLWNPDSFIHFNFLGNLCSIFIKIEKLDIRPRKLCREKSVSVILLFFYRFFTFNARIEFSTARVITPTSANMANHIFAIPTAPSPRQMNFTLSANAIF